MARAHSSRPRDGQRPTSAARAVIVAALWAVAGAAWATPPGGTPSGLPVPRYVSTKFREVNARGGPGDDHRMLWIYRVRGLPLQVVAETEEWRRVCDPDGQLAWVHKRLLTEAHTVMRASNRELLLRARPTETSHAPAVLAGRAIAVLDKCERGWCRVKVGKTGGWVRSSEVWGVDPARQCR